MKLSARIAIVVTLASVLPLLVSSVFATRIATQNAVKSSEEILVRDASAMATFVETWTSGQVDALRGWTVPFRLGENPALQESLLRAILLAMPTVVSTVLVDSDGFPVGPAQFVTGEGRQIGDVRPVVTRARAESVVPRLPLSEALEARHAADLAGVAVATGDAVGEPYWPDGSNVPSLPMAVAGPHDTELVLGAEVSLADVGRLLAGQTTKDHAVALFSKKGTAVLGGQHRLLDPQRLIPLMGTGADSSFSYELADGTGVRGALARVPSTEWTVVVAEPAAIVDATSAEIRRRTVQVLVVAMLLALGLGAVVSRTLVGPVVDLRDSALAMAEGDIGRQVAVESTDELGQLGQAFNHMSRRIQADQVAIQEKNARIEAFNEELQQRIDQRTRELLEVQARLVQSGQLAAVAQLGAGLAHELNNPLSAILGLSQVLRARNPADPLLQRVEEQAARCREVVAAMLRLSAGEVDSGDTRVLDYVVVVREAMDLASAAFRQRGVALVLQEATEPAQIRVDPVTGGRVLAQILNALRAGLVEGASLTLSVRATDADAILEMTPDRPIALEGAKDDWMASGMNLWVARNLLDRMGARLEEDRLGWRVIFPRCAP